MDILLLTERSTISRVDCTYIRGVQLKNTHFQPWAAGLEFRYFCLKTGVHEAEVPPFDVLLNNFKIFDGKVDFNNFNFLSNKSKSEIIRKTDMVYFCTFSFFV